MELEEAIQVIRALANGIHPQTKAALEENSVCRSPEDRDYQAPPY